MPSMVPLSSTPYLETRKEDIRNEVCTEKLPVPEVHKWLCHRQDYWVGEGLLRYAINKWQKAEPAQWNVNVLVTRSLPARPAPKISSSVSIERYSAPTQHGAFLVGNVEASEHQQMWFPTSSLGVGQGSMASTYLQNAPAEDAFLVLTSIPAGTVVYLN